LFLVEGWNEPVFSNKFYRKMMILKTPVFVKRKNFTTP